jgi:hypothetical protein
MQLVIIKAGGMCSYHWFLVLISVTSFITISDSLIMYKTPLLTKIICFLEDCKIVDVLSHCTVIPPTMSDECKICDLRVD